MKGEIFVEFINLVEDQFGLATADAILSDPELPSGGSYSRVATYSHEEMVRLVLSLSSKTGVDAISLQMVFGRFLFGRLLNAHPTYVAPYAGCFELMHAIHGVIHTQVRTLYPDADLPKIIVTDEPGGSLLLNYTSERGLGHVCHGLIEGCIEHFNEPIQVERLDQADEALVFNASFRLTRLN